MCNDCPCSCCSCCSCCPCITVCLFALLGLSASGTWHRDRLRFIRERASGYYHTLPFFCSKYVYDIVLLRLVPCAVFVLCSYDLIGYGHQYNSTYVNDDVNDDVNDAVNDECLLVLLVLSSPDQMLHIHARNTMGVCIYTSSVVFICLYVMVELTLPINYRSITDQFTLFFNVPTCQVRGIGRVFQPIRVPRRDCAPPHLRHQPPRAPHQQRRPRSLWPFQNPVGLVAVHGGKYSAFHLVTPPTERPID
jgi:hypothetical protein